MLEIGMKAPAISLPDQNGEIRTLEEFQGKKVILYFYPRDHTPGCTNEAKDFRDAIQSFKDQNAVILGVSRDSVQSHEKFVAKHDLPFILLSDTEETVCKQYDVLKEKNMYGKKAFGIERSTFIIDETGMITKIFRKVRVPNHVNQVLEQCTL